MQVPEAIRQEGLDVVGNLLLVDIDEVDVVEWLSMQEVKDAVVPETFQPDEGWHKSGMVFSKVSPAWISLSSVLLGPPFSSSTKVSNLAQSFN